MGPHHKEIGTMFRSEAQAGSSRLIVDGILALVVGGLILAFPGVTALTAVVLVASWSFVNGATEIAAGVSVAGAGGRSWPHALSGIASLAAAGLAITHPGLTLVGLVTIVGVWQVVAGLLAIGAAWQARDTLPGTALAMTAGGLRAGLGVAFVAMPATGLQVTVAVVAIDALIIGTLSLVAGLRVKSAIRGHDAKVETLVRVIEDREERAAA
jgi:uncharacterized membrane protein HdeD (DUF308 family)